jgi:hypothetical protein
MTVEELLFGKERSLGEVAVHYPDAVVFIVCGNQGVSCVFYRFEVTRRYVTADTDY